MTDRQQMVEGLQRNLRGRAKGFETNGSTLGLTHGKGVAYGLRLAADMIDRWVKRTDEGEIRVPGRTPSKRGHIR